MSIAECIKTGKSELKIPPCPIFRSRVSVCPYAWGKRLFWGLAAKIDEAVAYASLGQDIPGIGRVFFNLLAQIVDIQTDIVRLIPILIAPNLGQNLVVGENPASVLNQVVKQTIFCRPELHQIAV